MPLYRDCYCVFVYYTDSEEKPDLRGQSVAETATDWPPTKSWGISLDCHIEK